MTIEDQYKRLHNRATFFALACCFLIFALFLQLYVARTGISAYEYGRDYIPTITQLQQALIDTGMERYNPGKADGVVGKRTIASWENYIFDVYAGAWND